MFSAPSFALTPTFDISQYGHSTWTIRDGFFKGSIYAIAQTADGYLLLGTEFGLLRFDGVQLTAWEPPPGQSLPSNNVRSLLVTRDGTLWIGTIEGLASWKNGKLTQYPEMAGQNLFTMIEDHEGVVWAGTFGVPTARLCAIRAGSVSCHGEDGTFGQWVESVYEDSGGRLWAGTGTGLWRWKPGPPKRYSVPDLIETDHALLEDDDPSRLIVLCQGIWRMADGKTEPYHLDGIRRPFTPLNIMRDRDGGLWIGTLERGLLHSYQGRTDSFSRRDGLSGDHVRSLFEDREGNIWVASTDGLDRFRSVATTSVSVRQGLSSPSTVTALAARDGSVWTSTEDGLNRWKNGDVTIYRASQPPQAALPDFEGVSRTVHQIVDRGLADNQVGSLFEDDRGRIWVSALHGISRFENDRFVRLSGPPGGWVNGITGDGGGGVWIAYQDLGLYHVLEDRVVEKFPWASLGHGVASAMFPAPRNGGLWLGFFLGGLVHFEGGAVRASYSKKDNLGSGRVMGVQVDADGVVWAATEGGLSRVKDGRIVTLTAANGLPCDGVHWSVEDETHFFWLYTACGLVRVSRRELELWFSQGSRTIEPTVFDASDGVRMKALLTGYTPRVSQAADGKIWFAHLDSISFVDPRHLPVNDIPPPVHIEQMTADRKTHWRNMWGAAGSDLRLPVQSRDVQIDYTALSLGAPETIRFKYKLDANDRDWQDAGNRRQAFYNHLPPGDYRFRVIASNNRGVWNETGDALEFSIAPAFYQTAWFYASCVAAFLAMLWGLYRLRLYQVRREFNAQLNARVDERLRVAGELHDTLLQSFQASLIRMQVARNAFSRRPEEAAESLNRAIDMAAGAIAEGRNAIQGLRAEPANKDLAELLTEAAQELAHSEEAPRNPPLFRVTVEGERQDLEPLLEDEVYRIARELLRNAFRHAGAGRIEAEVRFERGQLRVHVRDDGKGIDPEILKAGGRAGHWGLTGMRERASRFGGGLEFWSEAGAGTEVVLTVPAGVAYKASNSGGPFSFLRGKKAGA